MEGAGALIQLNNYQQHDYLLTNNPEISFFSVVYRRYTNFGKIYIENPIDSPVFFNKTCTTKIQKYHDLMSDIAIKLKLPVFDLKTLNKSIDKKYKKDNMQEYELNYKYFIEFKRKLQNIITNFVNTVSSSSITYVEDLNTNIMNVFTIDDFYTYFQIVDFFLSSTLRNTDYYKNASLYKIIDGLLIYNYSTFSDELYLFNVVIKKNMSVLDDVDKIMYGIIKDLTFVDYVKMEWIDKIGIYLFEYFEIYAGSNLLVRMSDEYIDSCGSLKYTSTDLYTHLITNPDEIYLPLPFWFCEHYASAFPLVSVQHTDIYLKFKLRNYNELLKITVNTITMDDLLTDYDFISYIEEQLNTLSVTVIIEYIALDTFERQKFIQSGHEYMMNEINEITFNNVNQYNTNLVLNFHHCIRDLRWYVSPEVSTNTYFRPYIPNNNSYYVSYVIASDDIFYNLYLKSFDPDYIHTVHEIMQIESIVQKLWMDGTINTEIINTDCDHLHDNRKYPYCISSSLSLSSYTLFDQPYNFFNFLHPYIYYGTTPYFGTNVYSLSLYPNDIVPTGSFNIGRISYVSLNPTIQNINNDQQTYRVKVIATTINVLRAIGGRVGKAYHY